MKRKRYNRFCGLLLLLSVILCLAWHPVQVRADFGDFAGDSDYGDSDWGNDSDSGGGWFDDDSDDDDDDSWFFSDSGSGSNSSGGSSDSSGESAFGGFVIALFIVGVIIIISMANKGNKSSKSKPVAPGAQRTGNLRPMSEFKELDPEFDEAVLREKLSNLYIQMQNEWHNRNIESLKPYFTDAFYNQSERQIKQKIENHQTPCTERVAVFEVTPRGFYTSGGMDHIIVCVKSRLVAYTIDDNTGQVISGDKNKEKFMEYEWDICRKSGTLTNKTDGMKTVNCPNCGAPLNINQTTKCPFCMSVINIVNEDWALNGIKGISQRTQ